MEYTTVKAPATGTISRMRLQSGEWVDAGEPIMILESMKMEIPVESPVTGTVAEVLVQPEDQVEEDQVVAVVEAD